MTTVLGSALPWTLGLIGTTTILAFLIGTVLGVFAGWKRGTWVDGLLPATSFLSSIPYFWLGLIARGLARRPARPAHLRRLHRRQHPGLDPSPATS